MRKRTRVLLLAACLLLTAALAGLLARDSEPRYHGRSLSKWLALYWRQDSPSTDEAREAIRVIGTNALPYLLKWIRQEPPFWRPTASRTLPTPVWDSPHLRPLLDGTGSDRAAAAMGAFGILGTNAASTIPDLTSMMNDTTRPRTAARAAIALSTLGAPAFPYMIASLSNTNYLRRERIAMNLAAFMAHDVGTNACLPPLIAALNDPDPQVRSAASRALYRLTNAPAQ